MWGAKCPTYVHALSIGMYEFTEYVAVVSVLFGCHRQEAGARSGLPAVGMKLSHLVEKLQVMLCVCACDHPMLVA